MVVIDSSFLVAYHNERDVHHSSAREGMERLIQGEWASALLPEYVLLETVTVVAARRGAQKAVEVGGMLLRAEEYEFVPCSAFFVSAFDTFREMPGRSPSFADAAIVTIARERDAGFVATFDTDFRGIEGLTVVPDG